MFFYVDDIIVMFRKESQARFEQVKRGLFQAYEMKDLGELKWFLGVTNAGTYRWWLAWHCKPLFPALASQGCTR